MMVRDVLSFTSATERFVFCRWRFDVDFGLPAACQALAETGMIGRLVMHGMHLR
jgi:hypothetical protein